MDGDGAIKQCANLQKASHILMKEEISDIMEVLILHGRQEIVPSGIYFNSIEVKRVFQILELKNNMTALRMKKKHIYMY